MRRLRLTYGVFVSFEFLVAAVLTLIFCAVAVVIGFICLLQKGGFL